VKRISLGVIALMALLMVLVVTFTSCKANKDDEKQPCLVSTVENSTNEILTYKRLDPNRTQLVVAMVGNVNIQRLVDAFVQKNPGIQVTVLDITGGDGTTKPYEQWFENGLLPDVVFFSGTKSIVSQLDTHFFKDLSANAVLTNYQTEALIQMAQDEAIYALPGPATLHGMVYNKTMFDQYGWTVPETFNEFVQLCLQIKKDTDNQVTPWIPNAKYPNELITLFEGLTYPEILGGLENRTWLHNFKAGKATFNDHMKPLYDTFETLVKNGLFEEKHFTYSATTRWNEFLAGQVAMINRDIPRDFKNDNFEVGLFPYPGLKPNQGYLQGSISYYAGAMDTDRPKEIQDAAMSFLEYISTAEAQKLYIGDSLMISNLKNIPNENKTDFYFVNDAAQNGRIFSREDITVEGIPWVWSIRAGLMEIINGEKTSAQIMDEVDQRLRDGLSSLKVEGQPGGTSVNAAYATIQEDFTILETSTFFADTFAEKAGAQIGLMMNNTTLRGNLMRMFKGDVTDSLVTVLKPRSLANGSTLIKASMTGEQLLGALNDPWEDYDCVYAFSGLKCTVHPWNKLGDKVQRVTLADGKPIEKDALYTVAFWDGTIKEKYITDVLENIPGSFEEILIEKAKSQKTLSPAKDNRITLIWD